MNSHKRKYGFVASTPGYASNYPGKTATSNSRIRVVAVALFRKWFGREPSESWGKDGFMAEAWDKRGNRIEVEQYNHSLTRQWLTPDERLFSLFTFHNGKLVSFIPPSRQLPEKIAA